MSEDIRNMYRVRRTCSRMLMNRGYIVSAADTDISEGDFLGR